MKKGDIVIAPEGCAMYLTPFKEYKVKVLSTSPAATHGEIFKIKDDFGDLTLCLEKGCAFLNHQDWIIKTKAEKEWNELNGLIELTQEQAGRKEYLTKVLKK
jgi:hypothetical protein